MLQVVASPMIIILMTPEGRTIIILMTLEVSFIPLENIYKSTGITCNRHLRLSKYFIVQATGRLHYTKLERLARNKLSSLLGH
jgi:hypothetical protein